MLSHPLHKMKSCSPYLAAAVCWLKQQQLCGLQDAHASSLPVSVRAARDAIGSLLTKAGSQARPSALPSQHAAHHTSTAASGKPQVTAAQLLPALTQQLSHAAALNRRHSRPAKLKVSTFTSSSSQSGHGCQSCRVPVWKAGRLVQLSWHRLCMHLQWRTYSRESYQTAKAKP